MTRPTTDYTHLYRWFHGRFHGRFPSHCLQPHTAVPGHRRFLDPSQDPPRAPTQTNIHALLRCIRRTGGGRGKPWEAHPSGAQRTLPPACNCSPQPPRSGQRTTARLSRAAVSAAVSVAAGHGQSVAVNPLAGCPLVWTRLFVFYWLGALQVASKSSLPGCLLRSSPARSCSSAWPGLFTCQFWIGLVGYQLSCMHWGRGASGAVQPVAQSSRRRRRRRSRCLWPAGLFACPRAWQARPPSPAARGRGARPLLAPPPPVADDGSRAREREKERWMHLTNGAWRPR